MQSQVRIMMSQTEAEREQKAAFRVLEILDRWDDRMNRHQLQRREHTRKQFRVRMAVHIPAMSTVAGECTEAVAFDVWSRNISQSGACFIYRGVIKSKKVVICLNPDTGGSHWFQALIVRQRQVHNDFWEYGIRFTGPASI